MLLYFTHNHFYFYLQTLFWGDVYIIFMPNSGFTKHSLGIYNDLFIQLKIAIALHRYSYFYSARRVLRLKQNKRLKSVANCYTGFCSSINNVFNSASNC